MHFSFFTAEETKEPSFLFYCIFSITETVVKTLFLLRHAKSSWDFPELRDVERPLNTRGKQDAPLMGQWIKEHFAPPQLIISSHSVRTLATISKVAHELGVKGKEVRTDEKLFHASAAMIRKVMQAVSEEVESLMLVGHNPGFTDFANSLCPKHAVENIPTCGLYVVRFHSNSWKEATSGTAEFLCFQYPKKLK